LFEIGDSGGFFLTTMTANLICLQEKWIARPFGTSAAPCLPASGKVRPEGGVSCHLDVSNKLRHAVQNYGWEFLCAWAFSTQCFGSSNSLWLRHRSWLASFRSQPGLPAPKSTTFLSSWLVRAKLNLPLSLPSLW